MHSAGVSGIQRRADAVRRFNRFYTRRIGALREGLLASPYSLTQVRVLYELAHRRDPTASEIGADLGLDPGYLSRILRKLASRGLVKATASTQDARRRRLALTEKGRREFAPLDARSTGQALEMLSSLAPPDRVRLLGAMATIESLLGDARGEAPEPAPFALRGHRPGDMGWVVHRHGALYAEEYGWDERFEALVARIVAEFIERFDPVRERCWIAERGGEIVGSVFLVRQSATTAKLRLFLVEPSARGLGIGKHLVAECVEFARLAGYRKITLWTQKNLEAARHIYRKAGFRVTAARPTRSFGHDLVSETWERRLSGGASLSGRHRRPVRSSGA
jgi:DNA-binding MarR family transcriptional regulator/GNAT superfamily N-acetyltransferase